MSLEILQDPRVRQVCWKDLRLMSPSETLRELMLSTPWLVASWVVAEWLVWPVALPLSFVFFLLGLRLVHDAFHHNLGLPRWADDLVMLVLSGLMLGSMHAVQHNHLRHHAHCMADEDAEAWSARLPWWKAIVFGPLFPLILHWHAWRTGRSRVRRWMVTELVLTAGVLVTASCFLEVTALVYHVSAMVVGQCLTAFFAVWTVHHDCDRSHYIARTVRGRLRTLVTFNMFYHVEHHLYPAVPTRRLPELAGRLDAAAPELQSKRVF